MNLVIVNYDTLTNGYWQHIVLKDKHLGFNAMLFGVVSLGGRERSNDQKQIFRQRGMVCLRKEVWTNWTPVCTTLGSISLNFIISHSKQMDWARRCLIINDSNILWHWKALSFTIQLCLLIIVKNDNYFFYNHRISL